MIRAPELRDMLPALGPAVVGGSFTPYDGHASPLALLQALHRAFIEAGGIYVPNVKAVGGSAAPHDFHVETEAGTFAAPRIVLAAGLGNADLAPRFGLSAPVRPQRGQILVTERAQTILPMPTTTIRQTGEGTLMLGDSHGGGRLRHTPIPARDGRDRASRGAVLSLDCRPRHHRAPGPRCV